MADDVGSVGAHDSGNLQDNIDSLGGHSVEKGSGCNICIAIGIALIMTITSLAAVIFLQVAIFSSRFTSLLMLVSKSFSENAISNIKIITDIALTTFAFLITCLSYFGIFMCFRCKSKEQLSNDDPQPSDAAGGVEEPEPEPEPEVEPVILTEEQVKEFFNCKINRLDQADGKGIILGGNFFDIKDILLNENKKVGLNQSFSFDMQGLSKDSFAIVLNSILSKRRPMFFGDKYITKPTINFTARLITFLLLKDQPRRTSNDGSDPYESAYKKVYEKLVDERLAKKIIEGQYGWLFTKNRYDIATFILRCLDDSREDKIEINFNDDPQEEVQVVVV